jgi:hypothetical protein
MDDLLNIINSIKGKKVAFFHSHTLWPNHFDTELEIIDLFKKYGIEVISYVCNSHFEKCDTNFGGNFAKCYQCINKRELGFKAIDFYSKVIPIKIKNINYDLPNDIDIDKIKNLKYKNFDFGYAALSSIISRTRDPFLDIQSSKLIFNKYINNSISLYDFFIESLSNEKPSLVFIFNGRFSYTRALLRACEYLDIQFYTHERGSSKEKYMLFSNVMPHNIDYFIYNINKYWLNDLHSIDEKSNIGANYFKDKISGKELSWISFTNQQKINLLPSSWDKTKYNIGIFLSSEDEFIAISDEWDSGLFKNQIQGLEYLCNFFSNFKNIHIYIRIHPNSLRLKKFIERINEFKNEHTFVINPDSEISTYNLLFNVDKVLTFGSTVGLEATFWGKPSINLGISFYKNLNVTFNPSSLHDLDLLITDKDLMPKPADNAIKYGYYMSNFGYNFENYKANNLFDGKYKGFSLNHYKNIDHVKIVAELTIKNFFKKPIFYFVNILKLANTFLYIKKTKYFYKITSVIRFL